MLVKEGHGTELYEKLVEWLKPLIIIKRDLATTPAAEIPSAALFPTELWAAVTGRLVWGDGYCC